MGSLWQKWLKFAEVIGNINARIILTILYFLVFSIPSFFLTFIFDKVGKKFEDKESYYFNEKIKLESIEEAKEM